jgi:hypothetical protein
LEGLGETSRVMGGLDPKMAFAIVMTLGFWLLKIAKAIALVFYALNWK